MSAVREKELHIEGDSSNADSNAVDISSNTVVAITIVDKKVPETTEKKTENIKATKPRNANSINDIQRKRPSFLSDLRDGKKHKLSLKSVKPNSRSMDSHDDTIPTISAEELKDPEWSTRSVKLESKNTHSGELNETAQIPQVSESSTGPQKNWLGMNARQRGLELLARASENKQKKASVAMKYGW